VTGSNDRVEDDRPEDVDDLFCYDPPDMPKCEVHGTPNILRLNRATGGLFFGCRLYAKPDDDPDKCRITETVFDNHMLFPYFREKKSELVKFNVKLAASNLPLIIIPEDRVSAPSTMSPRLRVPLPLKSPSSTQLVIRPSAPSQQLHRKRNGDRKSTSPTVPRIKIKSSSDEEETDAVARSKQRRSQQKVASHADSDDDLKLHAGSGDDAVGGDESSSDGSAISVSQARQAVKSGAWRDVSIRQLRWLSRFPIHGLKFVAALKAENECHWTVSKKLVTLDGAMHINLGCACRAKGRLTALLTKDGLVFKPHTPQEHVPFQDGKSVVPSRWHRTKGMHSR